ncbi:uncharacterized protein A4U43_C05F130 [Asparagus officinalis]|uniref:Folylpolyglutamate synthase n=1 Tax=Asparagus officinalis TaxID=4686 RepID=A0A5P1EQP9_ASPOF|nr:uncharacterized protein A4U43_C05F130 [Asparagus officinalis]
MFSLPDFSLFLTGVHFSKALFAPCMSSYHRVNSAVSAVSSDISQDTTWQSTLQKTWEKLIHGKDVSLNNCYKIESPEHLPSSGFLNENYPSSAVIPSLPLTIKWLRDCVKDNPSLRLQVLVTGSLHLVGDVLKLLRR